MKIAAKNHRDDEHYEETDKNDMEYIKTILPSVIEKFRVPQLHVNI